MTPPLPASEIEARRQGHAFGHEVRVLESCPTTQAEARALAKEGAPHGALVVAHRQTQGRGRRGRAWLSAEGGLYFSVVLRPTVDGMAVPVERLPRIPLLAAAALLDGLRALGVDARVKWPNDVLLPVHDDGPLGPFRKVAGILAEPALREGRIEAIILGIGVNVRRPAGDFPAEIADIAGALEDAAPVGDPDEVLLALLDPLERWLALPDDDARFAACRALLSERSATLGRMVRVPEEDLCGTAEEIDPEGALLVRSDDGRLHRVIAGDVLPAG